jgi:hypothetical protein
MSETSTTSTLTPAGLDKGRQALHTVAGKIRAFQQSLPTELSDAAFVNRYPELGSDRTWQRAYTGRGIDQLNPAKWLQKYEAVWQRVQTEATAGAVSAEPLYPDLGPACLARAAVSSLMLQPERANMRLVVIEGDTGTGKSGALRSVAELWEGRVHRVDAHGGWARLRSGLQCLADACNVKADSGDRPNSASDWLELLVKRANSRGRRLILIDEAHEMGGPMLNAIKTLINRTDWCFVLAAKETLWSKLTGAHYDEAKQLTMNRMLRKISLPRRPAEDDAKLFLDRRISVRGLKVSTLRAVLDHAESRGSFAFLRRLVDHFPEVEGGDVHELVGKAARLAIADLG